MTDTENTVAWIEFGAQHHPDQEARHSAKELAKQIKDVQGNEIPICPDCGCRH